MFRYSVTSISRDKKAQETDSDDISSEKDAYTENNLLSDNRNRYQSNKKWDDGSSSKDDLNNHEDFSESFSADGSFNSVNANIN